MNIREQIVAEARGWLRTPYRHMARVKGAGVDCAMLLLEVYQATGLVPVFDIDFYPPDWHLHRGEERYLRHITEHAHQVAVPQPGDVALFRFARCVSHGAIVVKWPTVIHAYFRQGVVLADANGGELAGRLDSFWSVIEGEA